MILSDFSPLGSHLWQSTLCVVAAWLLTLALRRNRAAVRYLVWLAASVKFVIPFSLLVDLGRRFGWHATPAVAPSGWSGVMEDLSRSFTGPFPGPTSAAPAILAPAAHSMWAVPPLPVILLGIWLCGFGICVGLWVRNWRRARAIERRATPLRLRLPIPVVASSTLVEPGVFGIVRPVLLLPEGIMERLTPAQFDAIVAHEMCHVRRRDNLAAAIHMGVEAIFWFHPLVWLISARLMEERERACDEEVLDAGNEREAYAEGILNVCKFYTESPLACASGISGSDLKSRIVRIMTQHMSARLSAGRKLLLAIIAAAAILGPVIFGVASAPALHAQTEDASTKALPSFEVASVKPNHGGSPNRFFRFSDPSRFTTTNIPAKDLIEFAYHVQPFQISGGPAWINSDGYDIEAKVDDSVVAELEKLPPEQRGDQVRLMLRSLLAERFKLSLGHETKELPIYDLVVAKDGPKLTPTTGPAKVQGPDRPKAPAGPQMMMSPGRLTARYAEVSMLAEVLGRQPELGGRLVVDKTGLTGKYDFSLEFAPEMAQLPPGTSEGPRITGGPGMGGGPPMALKGPPPPDPNAPSIFTAIEEQLGLKLESTKGPVDVLVIQSIERPSEN